MEQVGQLISRALAREPLEASEGVILYRELPLARLMALGHHLRQHYHPGKDVTWMIDRNVNITNVCMSGCLFCNFYRGSHSREAYITTLDSYIQKIEELKAIGGNQLLLQGGMHPDLGLSYYTSLFRDLKQLYPDLRLHALGPPEIVHLSHLENIPVAAVLNELVAAGLSSLPGAGAEMLCDRVRQTISPRKCSTREWLDVMREAHRMDLTTSATMMFGHVETLHERMEHLVALRQVQSEKPTGHKGFLNFIAWPFQDEGTTLRKKRGVRNSITSETYIRMIALSRIMLPNIPHIQASWLTVGKDTAQLCLHAGANDFGSIMIEENVVSVAGARYAFDAEGICRAIRETGYEPVQRDQDFNRV